MGTPRSRPLVQARPSGLQQRLVRRAKGGGRAWGAMEHEGRWVWGARGGAKGGGRGSRRQRLEKRRVGGGLCLRGSPRDAQSAQRQSRPWGPALLAWGPPPGRVPRWEARACWPEASYVTVIRRPALAAKSMWLLPLLPRPAPLLTSPSSAEETTCCYLPALVGQATTRNVLGGHPQPPEAVLLAPGRHCPPGESGGCRTTPPSAGLLPLSARLCVTLERDRDHLATADPAGCTLPGTGISACQSSTASAPGPWPRTGTETTHETTATLAL